MQMIVRHGMKAGVPDPTDIFPMDDLAHEPEVFFDGISGPAQILHKTEIQDIRRIQADPVYIKLLYPKADHIANIFFYRRIPLVQPGQQVETAPVTTYLNDDTITVLMWFSF